MGMLAFEANFPQSKFFQIKNLAFSILFFQMSSDSLFFTYQSKKYNEDIYFRE